MHHIGEQVGPVGIGRSVAAAQHLLAADLERLRDDGFTAAEFSVGALLCILGGRLSQRRVEPVAALCAEYRAALRYSVHSPAALDLRDGRHPDLHRDILLATIGFAAAIRAGHVVVHYEARSDDPTIEAQYRAAILQGADMAGRHGVMLCVENIEVERSERVVEFVAGLDHPHVRMTYDFGHDYLAADLFGYDFLAAARACAPYVAHLHLTDNFGRFNPARLGDFAVYQAIPYSAIATPGLGDLHLPIGFGTLPIAEAYAPFAERGYGGLLISEHEYGHFPDAGPEVFRRMEALARG